LAPRFSRVRRALAKQIDPLVLRRANTLAGRDPAPGLAPNPRKQALTWLRNMPESATRDPRVAAAVSEAFTRLWQPRHQPVPEPPAAVLDAIRDQFHRLFYHVSLRTWQDTWYRGILTYKCPTDMWVYQELIHDLRPGLVVETGTFRGGSALFIADLLETVGHGEIITIDIEDQPDRPSHPRLTYLTGSSVATEVVDSVRRRLPTNGSPVIVILDSEHSRDHVAAEIKAYAPLVTVGSYLVVEDTNVNGHPAAPYFGPGPYEAAEAFLEGEPGFEVDPRCERYFLTLNPSGYLRRVR
jgi:cephalosporin hydroxylase